MEVAGRKRLRRGVAPPLSPRGSPNMIYLNKGQRVQKGDDGTRFGLKILSLQGFAVYACSFFYQFPFLKYKLDQYGSKKRFGDLLIAFAALLLSHAVNYEKNMSIKTGLSVNVYSRLNISN